MDHKRCTDHLSYYADIMVKGCLDESSYYISKGGFHCTQSRSGVQQGLSMDHAMSFE